MDFQLLETTKLNADGSIFLLDRHLQRLANSATHFGFTCDLNLIRAQLLNASSTQSKPSRIRLLLDPAGVCEIQFGPVPSPGALKLARLSNARVESTDPMLRHKTTSRKIYTDASAGYPEDTDAILSNEKGQLSETTIANFAVHREGLWVTPALECGLLPGTLRAEMLEKGEVIEGILYAADLRDGEPIRCYNSVRGLYDLRFVETKLATP